jgi:putative ubiquitin-RnfH superfamily antitoxin RatB of RatAB toxin-antitoxin module
VIHVEVAYALPDDQFLVELEVNDVTSVAEAITKSGLFERYPELKQLELSIGIYSRPVTADTKLSDGDRVEIYRPLTIDPKEARRLRAAAKNKKQN